MIVEAVSESSEGWIVEAVSDSSEGAMTESNNYQEDDLSASWGRNHLP